jgi:hypothetical protein
VCDGLVRPLQVVCHPKQYSWGEGAGASLGLTELGIFVYMHTSRRGFAWVHSMVCSAGPLRQVHNLQLTCMHVTCNMLVGSAYTGQIQDLHHYLVCDFKRGAG